MINSLITYSNNFGNLSIIIGNKTLNTKLKYQDVVNKLCCNSKVINIQVHGKFKESFYHKKLEFKDLEILTLTLAIETLYLEKKFQLSNDELVKLANFSERFQVEELKNLCINNVKKAVKRINFFDILDMKKFNYYLNFTETFSWFKLKNWLIDLFIIKISKYVLSNGHHITPSTIRYLSIYEEILPHYSLEEAREKMEELDRSSLLVEDKLYRNIQIEADYWEGGRNIGPLWTLTHKIEEKDNIIPPSEKFSKFVKNKLGKNIHIHENKTQQERQNLYNAFILEETNKQKNGMSGR